MVDINTLVQAILFALFFAANAALSAVTGPMYDGLLVPQLNGAELYPTLPVGSADGGGFLTVAAAFSNYLLVNLVDPAVAVVIIAVGLLYMLRGTLGRFSPRMDGLFSRTLIAVVVANFTVPIGNALLGIGGATFPIIAQFDTGAWRHWVNLAGVGGISFSWDNGAIAFVLSFILFFEVLSLALVLAFRDAALAVLLVLLPLFTLLWPLPPLAGLARRGWKLFGELVFLPCIILIPLELAVGSPNVLILVGYLGLALAAPALISTGSTQLGALGFPAVASAFSGGLQRGLSSLSGTSASWGRGIAGSSASGGPLASGVGAAVRTMGTSSFPATVPLLTGEIIGRAGYHLLRHLQRAGTSPLRTRGFPPVRPPRSPG